MSSGTSQVGRPDNSADGLLPGQSPHPAQLAEPVLPCRGQEDARPSPAGAGRHGQRAVKHAGLSFLPLTPMHAAKDILTGRESDVPRAFGHVKTGAEPLASVHRSMTMLSSIVAKIVVNILPKRPLKFLYQAPL